MEIIAGAVKNKNRQDPHDFKAVVVNGFNVCKLFVVSFWGLILQMDKTGK